MRKSIALTLSIVLSIGLALVSSSTIAKPRFQVEVTEPYLNLRTGPGRFYPIFYVAERGQSLTVIKRKAFWYKVRMTGIGQREIVGWAYRDDLGKTQVADLGTVTAEHPRMNHAYEPRFRAGFFLGDLNEADSISGFLAFQATPLIDTELHAGKWVGGTEEGWFVNGQLVHVPFRKWWIKPFLSVGYGHLEREARGTNILQLDNSDNFLLSGSGLQVRISSQFQLRLEYRHFNTLTSRNDNSELEQWQVGLSANF